MRGYSILQSVIGELFLVAEDEMLSVIHLGEEDFMQNENIEEVVFQPEHHVLVECSMQLTQYFTGDRRQFDLPLATIGTEFQKSVWQQLSMIPFGETRSYRDIAESVGKPKAVRAIGQANKANRFPIIIPCHRVIGSNQTLTGYAGSRVDLKETLLRLEGVL
jgi:methylated-DNA-[protein]-cysteine S-methyltransferase